MKARGLTIFSEIFKSARAATRLRKFHQAAGSGEQAILTADENIFYKSKS